MWSSPAYAERRSAAEAAYKTAKAAFDALTTPAKGVKRSSPGADEPKKLTLLASAIESALVCIDGEQYVKDAAGSLRKLVGPVFPDADTVVAAKVAATITKARAKARASARAAGGAGALSDSGAVSPAVSTSPPRDA